jgi:hypothetical protein
VLLSPTLVLTCAHVVLERQPPYEDATWPHFRRSAISVNGIEADLIAAGAFETTNDPDLAFLRCRNQLLLPVVELAISRLAKFWVYFSLRKPNRSLCSPCFPSKIRGPTSLHNIDSSSTLNMAKRSLSFTGRTVCRGLLFWVRYIKSFLF